MSQATQSFQAYLASARERIDRRLEGYLSPETGCPEQLTEAMRYSLLAGGKRLRPLLVLMGCETCGGDPEFALPAACAVEMIHTYSLIHDDLPAMDDDDLRRGRPTCHKKFGEAVAILAGDALLTLAFEVLSEDSPSADIGLRCCRELARSAGHSGMVGGQVDDLAAEELDGSLAALESLHQRKTGSLLRGCLRLGAAVAEAEDSAVQALDAYGRAVGLAFQIVDDLLDVEGDVDRVGKRVGKDSNQQKLTYPGLLGVKESRRRAEELCEEACRQLSPFGEAADRLKALARLIVERDR